MTRPDLPQPESKWTSFVALIGAFVMAAGLFLMIPLTQTLDAQPREILEYREVAVAAPPPPKAPPPPNSSENSVQETPQKPQLDQSKPQMELSQLEISLNPGMGASLSMGVQQMQFDTQIDVVAEIERIFEFEELTQPPRIINQSQLRYRFPPDLARRGVREVKVVLEIIIEESGKTDVRKILSSTHPGSSADEEARSVAARARFTITKIDGNPVKVRAKFPLVLKSR